MAFRLNNLFGSRKNGDRPAASGDRGRENAARGARSGEADSRGAAARQLKRLVAALLVLLAAIGALAWHGDRQSAYNAAWIVAASDLGMLSQRIARAASLALRGDPAAFEVLRDSHRRFASGLETLKNGGVLGGLAVPPPPDEAGLRQRLDELGAAWESTGRGVQPLLKAEKDLAVYGKYLGQGERAYAAARSEEERQTLDLLEAASGNYAAMIDGALGGLRPLAEARQAGARLIAEEAYLSSAADALAAAYRQSGSAERLICQIALGALAFLALAVIAVIARTYINDARRQEELAEIARKSSQELEKTNNQNQNAILRLMNELGDLADGDLTVTASVSDVITGAIADSINYTVEELRVLVGRINDASARVTAATEIAQRTSVELLDATRRQSRVIQEVGHSVLEAASSMTQASGDANQSAQVARHSLAAAGKGTQAVQDSIKGMNEIREQIQETSKRIKRLGESSQEIGEIVELISDITEQTNVLALNAAIQAASAGEAGRGFTVVAEEVQRLAERSGEATKQIAAIVKTIQTDTQGAVSAMEKSTRGVVEGAKRSDAAGQALAEIGAVSQNLANLIERISQATRKQAEAATGAAGKMRDILQVTEQTTAGTQRTASAVGELAGLATELKGSVAGFKVG